MARFVELQPNQGVDSLKPGEEWMMVPIPGVNLVCLSDGTGYSPPAEKKGGRRGLKIVEVSPKQVWGTLSPVGSFLRPDTRYFQVSGAGSGGETAIEAQKGGLTVNLKVSVHLKRKFDIAFYFLQDRDPAGNITARTAFAPSDADGWIQGLNAVFGAQANIWFTKKTSEFLPLDALGSAVGTASDLEKFAAKYKVSGADISVFLAGSTIETLDHGYPLGFFDSGSKAIVVKDQFVADPWDGLSQPMLKTIAHEIGHFMNDKRGRGEGHDFFKKSGYRFDILNTLEGDNIKISRQRVLDWNPW